MNEKTEINPKGAGAPLGNTNSSKINRLWAETIKRKVVQSEGEIMSKIADALLIKASEGDMSAIKEFGDRMDGKVIQQIDQKTEHSGSVAYKWIDSDE